MEGTTGCTPSSCSLPPWSCYTCSKMSISWDQLQHLQKIVNSRIHPCYTACYTLPICVARPRIYRFFKLWRYLCYNILLYFIFLDHFVVARVPCWRALGSVSELVSSLLGPLLRALHPKWPCRSAVRAAVQWNWKAGKRSDGVRTTT